MAGAVVVEVCVKQVRWVEAPHTVHAVSLLQLEVVGGAAVHWRVVRDMEAQLLVFASAVLLANRMSAGGMGVRGGVERGTEAAPLAYAPAAVCRPQIPLSYPS